MCPGRRGYSYSRITCCEGRLEYKYRGTYPFLLGARGTYLGTYSVLISVVAFLLLEGVYAEAISPLYRV